MLQKSIHNLRTRCMIYRFEPTHMYLWAEILRLNFKIANAIQAHICTLQEAYHNGPDCKQWQKRPAEFSACTTMSSSGWYNINNRYLRQQANPLRPQASPFSAHQLLSVCPACLIQRELPHGPALSPPLLQTAWKHACHLLTDSLHMPKVSHPLMACPQSWLVLWSGFWFACADWLAYQSLSALCLSSYGSSFISNSVRLPLSNRRTSSGEHYSACTAVEMVGTWRANW